MKKCYCPFCYKIINIIYFKCLNKCCVGKGNYFFPGKYGFKSSLKAACPHCGVTSFSLVCPNCHRAIPEGVVRGSYMVITIIGNRWSGCSTFTSVMFHELKNRIAYNSGITIDVFHDLIDIDGYVSFEEREKIIFQENTFAHKCIGRHVPLIMDLSLKHGKNNIKKYTLVIMDFLDDRWSDNEDLFNYISVCNGIIFLLDPMQIPGIVEGLRNTENINDSFLDEASGIGTLRHDSTVHNLITPLSDEIKSHSGMKYSKRIRIPVATVFTKYDAFEPIVPEGFVVKEPSPHCKEGKFNDSDRKNVDSEIKSMLYTWGATAFTPQLEQNYTTYSYFACSALGINNNPVGGKFNKPHPHRIEDPILWLMKMNGIIK